jgi:Tol biopolymer transport system component/C-terminal processing protease CtpA/Prc
MRTSFALARRFPPFVLNGLALPSIAVIGRIGVLLTILTLTGSWVSAATEIRLAGNAALSPDGTQLAFSWRGDIWTVPTAGGTAQPLTMDEAQDSQPEFSPDGTQVAFVSDRTGSDQLFIMPAAGGSPQQVTFHTEGYSLLEWYPDGQSLLTMATRDNFWKHAERFFRVSTKPRSGESLVFDAYGRDGTLSPDGQRMLFTREGTRWWRKGYQGSQASQIWLYDLKKNKFQQVVSHPSGCRSPLWDPSGTAMYYVSGESGAMNLWRRDLDTGEQTQLTEFPDDSVLFPRISRDGKTIVFRHLFDFYVLHPDDGKPAQRIEICYEGDESRDELLRRTLASATDVAFSKDGLEVAFIAGGDVWVMDTELREPKQVTDSAEEERNLLFAPDGSALIFASDQGGQCDIWRATRENEDAYWWQNDQFQLKRLTNDTTVEEGLSWSPAGDMIGFIKSTGDLWVMKPDGDDARKILTSWNAPDYDWSPDGKWLVYAVSDADFNRDVFVLPVDGSREPFNLSLHPDNDRSPVWSPDGTMIAFTGRRYGDEVDICYVQLRTDKSEETSRDRKLKAALEKMKKMRRAKPSSGGDTPTSSRAKPGDFRGMDMDRNLRPPTLSGGLLDEELQQDPPKQDPPAQDPPAQDPPAQDPPAQDPPKQDPPAQDPPKQDPPKQDPPKQDPPKQDPPKQDPPKQDPPKQDPPKQDPPKQDPPKQEPPKQEPPKQDPESKDAKKETGSEEEKNEDKAIRIDFEGIHDRITRVSIPNSSESNLFWSHDSKRLAFQAEVDGRSGTYTITLAPEPSLKPKLLTTNTGSHATWIATGNQILWLSKGVPTSFAASNGKATTYSFSVKQAVETAKRYETVFMQCWRVMRDNFYDQRLNNRNWDAVYRKYSEMAAASVDMSMLSQVVSMMLGELNGSHLGFMASSGGRSRGGSDQWRDTTVHLGVRFVQGYKGPGLKVRDVIWRGPADRQKSKIEPGEIILSIDGTTVDPDMDLTTVLNGDRNRDIELSVKNSDGETRTVTLRPTSYAAVRSRLYEMWVRQNREIVAKASDGKLGYLHIQGMNMSSFRRFEKELYEVAAGKDGIVIDVRENGGGSTTDHLLTSLTQPAHAITLPRDGERGYPQDRMIYATWRKPIIVLCNQNSFSNAEIFAHAIKTLKRGRVVGVATSGSVISTGGTSIMDVGFLRVPFRGWFLLNSGLDMELNGAEPHVTIWPKPGELPRGVDRQLNKAVQLLKVDVKKWKQRSQPTLRSAAELRAESE